MPNKGDICVRTKDNSIIEDSSEFQFKKGFIFECVASRDCLAMYDTKGIYKHYRMATDTEIQRFKNGLYGEKSNINNFLGVKNDTMEVLLDYFYIKKDESNPLWKKYLNWLNPNYFGNNNYYGKKLNVSCSSFSESYFLEEHIKKITLEQWDLIINKNKTNVKNNSSTNESFSINGSNSRRIEASRTRQELRGFKSSFNKSYRRQRIGIEKTSGRRRF